MSATRAIRGGRVVCPTAVLDDATVVVRDGRIAGVLTAGEALPPEIDDVVDAAGLTVLPGAVDPHVHFGDPGQLEREDFGTGTASAALGGISCVAEHPLTTPPTTTAALYADKLATVGPKAHVDFLLWGALVPGRLEEIAGQWRLGARGFKAFLCDSAGSYPLTDDDTLREGMKIVAGLGGLVLVHAENDAIVAGRTAKLRATGRRDGLAHALGRPEVAEAEAAGRAIELARSTGVRLQVVHTSAPRAAQLVDVAAADGVPVTLEHTAHHLLLDHADAERAGAYARCAPPLRARASVEALWARLLSGAPAQLGSDHSPYTHAEKAVADVFDAGMGIQSVQESVSLVLDEAIYERGLPLPRAAALIAGTAAGALGLSGVKGTIVPGADADLALWDLRSPAWTVDAASQQRSRNPWSPFDGRRVRVRLHSLLVRGDTVVRDGELVGTPGRGRFVVPGAADRESLGAPA